MGSCLCRETESPLEDEGTALQVLRAENERLLQEVASLEMELYQAKSEASRLAYIANEEARLASLYKTKYWRLVMADLLASRRLRLLRST